MLHALSNRMAARLKNRGIINDENIDVYTYGFELLFSFLFSTSVIILIGTIMSKILETLVFLSIFVILRSYTGGYHAETYAKCTVVTFSTYILVILLTVFIEFVPKSIYILGTSLCLLIIGVLAPIENQNKKILSSKKIRHKVTSIILGMAFSVIGLLFYRYNVAIVKAVLFSIIADVILMFPTIIMKGEVYG